MDSNLQKILSEFEELKGQFVITESWDIERLIAIGDDEQDYYYVTYNGRETKWNTCVGSVIPLKGRLTEKEYGKFINISGKKIRPWFSWKSFWRSTLKVDRRGGCRVCYATM